MPIDASDFVGNKPVKEGKVWNGSETYKQDPTGEAKYVMMLIEKLFPEMLGTDAKLTTRDAQYPALAETGGFLGNEVALGNVRHRLGSTVEFSKTPGIRMNAPEELFDSMTTILHELRHVQGNANKDQNVKAGLGDDWKSLIADASKAGFPSVDKPLFGGDRLEEFLASAVILDQMQQKNIFPGGNWKKLQQQELPKLKQSYPWLEDYLQQQRFAGAPELKAAPIPLLDKLKGFFGK